MPIPHALLALPFVLAQAGSPGQPAPAPSTPPPAPGYAPPQGYGYPPPGYGYPPPGYAYPPGYGYPPPGYAYPPGYGQPPAAREPAKPPPKPPEPPPTYLLRIGLAFGAAAASDHKDLLQQEGYSLGLVWLELTGAYMFSEVVGVGAWGALSSGSSTPANGGPRLDFDNYYAGAELPITVGSRNVRMLIAPRLGWAWGSLELAGNGKTQSAPAYGLELGVLFPKAYLGIVLGWVRAPVDPPGELGRDYDLGATSFGIAGVIDG